MAESPGGVEVARLSARVLPDTSRMYDELRADLAEIEARVLLEVRTSIDTTDLVEQARRAVSEAQAAAGDIDIKANVNSSQTGEAARAFSDLGSSISSVTLAAAALGPALIPLAAGLGAVAFALTGPLVLGVGGASLFAFLTGAAIKQTEDQKKKIDSLKASLDSAKQALTNTSASAATSAKNSLASAQRSAQQSITSAQHAAATATTAAGQVAAAQRIQAAHAALNARQAAISASQSASTAAAQRKYNDALLKYQAALHGLTPAQEKFLEAQKGLSQAFRDLIVKVGPALLGPPTQALTLMANVLPSLEPILRSFSLVFSDFLTAIGDETHTKGFKDTITLFATAGASSFREFGNIVVNLGIAFGNFAKLFLPFGESLMQTFVVASRGLARFSRSANASNGIRKFLDYVHDVGPLVTSTLAAISAAVLHLLVALAPLGTVGLEAVKGLADVINSIPTHTLTVLTASVIGLVAGLKLVGPALTSSLGALGLSNPEVAAVVAGVLALAAGFVLLYRDSQPFRKVISDLGTFITTDLIPPIQSAAQDVMPALRESIASISKTIRENQGFLETFGKALLAISAGAVILGIEALVVSIREIAVAFRAGVTASRFFANQTLGLVRIVIAGVSIMTQALLQSFGNVLDALAASYGQIPGFLTNGLSSAVKGAAQDFHTFVGSTDSGIGQLQTTLAKLQGDINGVGNSHPTFHIDSNTLQQIAQLHELQALQISDKHFKITAQIEAAIERTVGPGGGIGHPGAIAPRGVTPSAAGGGSSGGAAAGINIQNAKFADARDARRQASKWLRGRAGGGFVLNISPATGG